MADVMLGGVLRAARFQQFQHLLFQFVGIDAFFDDVILMEDVAHKVTVIELMHQLIVYLRRQMLKPLGIITAQGDIQRQDIFHLVGVYRLVTDSGPCGGKAVKKRFAPLFRGAGKEIALGIAEVFRKNSTGYGNRGILGVK